MPNDNRKNQSKPEHRNGQQPGGRDDFGGNQKVNRDLDDQDRNKMGEQEGQEEREPQSGRDQSSSEEPSKGELGNEVDDNEDELEVEDIEVEDENRVTQRNPAQRPSRDSDSSK